jgi:MYM-type Zinc finger with FCS sequence motif
VWSGLLFQSSDHAPTLIAHVIVIARDRCRFCGNQFPIKNGHLEAWYNGQGAYFCNEYCASEEGRHDRCEGSSGACIAVRDLPAVYGGPQT